VDRRRLEEQVQKVDLLFDILEGEHLLSRNETSAAPSGPGPAGYEPCPSWPRCLGFPTCRSCDGSGYVKSRHGRFDPYLPREAGPVLFEPHREDEPMPIKVGGERDNLELLKLAWANRNVVPPATAESVKLTRVERNASDDERRGVRRSLGLLNGLIARAEESMVMAALKREREGLEWFAKRLPLNLYVPGY
jgi:hypothetical protein